MPPRSPTLPHADAAALIRWCGAADDDLRALARVAARLDVLFVLEETPDFVAIGAVFEVAGARFSATGAGRGRRAALGACLGEAVETIAQTPAPGDMVDRGTRAAPPPGAAPGLAARLTVATPVDWMRAVRLQDGRPGLVPAPLVLRSLTGGDAAPLSLGCAAGASRSAAGRAGALELFERAAVTAWRADGSLARALREQPATPAPWMARIEPEGSVPVVAAVSSIAEGFGAGETEREAAAAALRELRAAEAAARFALQRGAPGRAVVALPPAAQAPAQAACLSLDAALRASAGRGRFYWTVDLTRPDLGVPVVKVLASGADTG